MDRQDKLLDKVSMKTNISKNDILMLAQVLSTKDLNNDQDIRDFIFQISKMTGKPVNETQINKIISLIKNNQVPNSLDKLV